MALSGLYGLLQRLRVYAYGQGIWTVRRLPCRVISIGNLTVGGTGKTPAVELVARLLQGHGFRVAILSRGYRGRHRRRVAVVSDGNTLLLTPREAGDEAWMLARRLPGVPVLVGSDRYALGMWAVRQFGVQVVVLDDGYQHLRLARDLNLLLIDAGRPLGGHYLLPLGSLREPLGHLQRADLVLLTKWRPGLAEPLSLVALGLRPELPIYRGAYRPEVLVDLNSGEQRAVDWIRDKRVLAVSGIADPASFQDLLTDLGARVVAHLTFPDHHPFSRRDLAWLTRQVDSAGVELVLTTEKDGVRLQAFLPLPVSLWEVRIRLEILQDEGGWQRSLLQAAAAPR